MAGRTSGSSPQGAPRPGGPGPGPGARFEATGRDSGSGLPVLRAGGGLPGMPDHVRAAVTYSERYRFVELDRLEASSVRVVLTAPRS